MKRLALCTAAALALILVGGQSAISAGTAQEIVMASTDNPQAQLDTAAKMDTATKTNAFHEVLQQMGAGKKIDPKLWDQFVAAQNDGIQTGPKVGEKVPDFTLPDQNGKQWSLHELMGPKGLLLVFTRSADW
jgi:AhpC/TSA family